MNIIDYDELDMTIGVINQTFPLLKLTRTGQQAYSDEAIKEFDLRAFENILESRNADLWPRDFRRMLEFLELELLHSGDDFINWKSSGTDRKCFEDLVTDLMFFLRLLACDYIPEYVESIFGKEDKSVPAEGNSPSDLTEKRINTISDLLGADPKKAVILFTFLKDEQLLDKEFKPTFSCNADKSFMAYYTAKVLGLQNTSFWKSFGELWGIKNAANSYFGISETGNNRKSLSPRRKSIIQAIISVIKKNDILNSSDCREIIEIYKV